MIGIHKIVSGVSLGLTLLTGCSLDNIVKVDKHQIDRDVDPKYLDTRQGALGLLYSALGSFQEAFSETSLYTGVLTDELTSRPYMITADYRKSLGTGIDARVEPDNYLIGKGISFGPYAQLQATRIKAGYARHFLRRQSDSSLGYAISASYAYEGYAMTLMAENLCSGIPLSDVQYGKESVYGKAIPTDSLLKIAVSKFDSALSISHDSVRYTLLARIGKARALVSLGRYEDAANTVSDVQQNDKFRLTYTETAASGTSSTTPADAFWTMDGNSSKARQAGHEIVNREGINGLVWYTNPNNIDPRLPVTVQKVADTFTFTPVVRQAKFPSGSISVNLASWVEAKLIESEYLLSIDDPQWLSPLNEARRSIGLSDTTAPSSMKDKTDLLFRERAYWFYGHGTRLSDMRRLVRQYGRPINSVYPIGEYSRASDVFTYSDAVVFIPSIREHNENYAYSGCINRNP